MRGFAILLAPLLVAGLVGCGGGSGSGGSASASTAAGVSSLTSATPVGATSSTVAGLAPVGSVVLVSGLLHTLTYNVAGLPQGISASNPTTNIPQISPKLNTYDLVLTQEDFVFYAPLIRDARHAHKTPPLTGYSTFMGDGLDTFASAPFTGLQRVKWSVFNGIFNNANDGLASKGFSLVRLEVSPGVTIDVYDLHADAGGSAGDEGARETQFVQLAQFIAHYSANQPLIVGGDTNLSTRRSPRDEATLQTFMTATGTTDVARTLGGDVDCIDRVLVRSTRQLTITPTRWRVADEFVDAQLQPLSDHDAIHVDLEWKYVR